MINFFFLINIAFKVSAKLALTGSLSRLLHSLIVLAIRKCVPSSKSVVSFYFIYFIIYYNFIINIQNK